MLSRVLLLVALAVVAASASDVQILTEGNFDATIKANEFVLVEFFAPWCGHCKKLAPEFEEAATTLKADNIVLASVDATEEKELGSRFGVRGYPTLKVFKNGKDFEYKGGRTAETIVTYMRKTTGPPAVTVTTVEALEAAVAANKVITVGFFASETSAEAVAFIKAAKEDEDHVFAITTTDAVAAANGVTAPAVVLFKAFDGGKAVFAGTYDKAEIAAFVATESVPLVIPFSMDVVQSIFKSATGVVPFLFTDDAAPEWYTALATEYKGKATFAVSDSKTDRLNSHMGLAKSDFPTFLIMDTKAEDGAMKKFVIDGAFSEESVKALIAAYFDGSAKPHYKSEEIPEQAGDVTVIVGKNFDDIVLDAKKNVLLEIYAPWCGHCKKLEPVWNELGEHYSSNEAIVIAKMDGTANEVEGLSARGFPTIKFFPAKAGKTADAGEAYEGGRTLEDFKTFLDGKAGESHDEL